MLYSQVYQHIIGWGNCERTILWHLGWMKKYWRKIAKMLKTASGILWIFYLPYLGPSQTRELEPLHEALCLTSSEDVLD